MKLIAALGAKLSRDGQTNPDAVVFWATTCLTIAVWLLVPAT